MSIQKLSPEMVNLIAAQLDAPPDLLAFESSCRRVRKAVQTAGPSSTWGQMFHRKLQKGGHAARLTVGLMPPQNYRDATCALPLKQKLHQELTAIRRHPRFYVLNLHAPQFGRLKLPHEWHRQQALDEAFDRHVRRQQVILGHIPGLLPYVEALAQQEVYESMGQDPSRALAILKLSNC
jgi:hypothetical protein